jgi:eukaryotic-like serine/threonine-protein kinase
MSITYPDQINLAGDTAEGERIGPYKLLRILGEGGMGVVYEALQAAPVRRHVALKVIKVGMDTKAFVARFDVERQALAVMNHAGIARVLDAGTVGTRPYYVMELVAGVPITEFCDDKRLTTAERLRLFMEVCNAVQHAHQKGIIHRDLKPSNVLVATQDDRPVPKVIDFGIAKALGQDLTDSTIITKVGEAVGTPAYMSPEQWESGSSDIDTRTDIYSLGVILFEMLAGKLPYDPAELARIGSSAPLLLRHRSPPTPTGAIRSMGTEAATVAYLHRTDLHSLLKQLRGDLDWISGRCIDPDRTRRYETAHELSLDIARHLRSEPILARPPSARYRAGRFFMRHRVGVSITALAVLGSIAFTIVTAVQARRIGRERDRATAEAAKSRALNAFLEGTLLSPDPIGGIGRDATMVQALDSATARLPRQPIASPAVEASVKSAIGWAYYNLGLYDKADPLLGAALLIRQSLAPPDSLALAESLMRAGQLDDKLARYGPAASRYANALAIRRRIGSDTSRALASSLVVIGGFAKDRGDTTRSLSLLQESASIYSAAKDPAGLAQVENELGLLEIARGNSLTAEQHLQRSLAYYRQRFGRHPLVAQELTILAGVLTDLHRPADAEAAYREALEIGREKLGLEHDMVTATMNNLGVFLIGEGKPDEAKVFLREAVVTDERKLGGEHPQVAAEMINLSKAICRGSSEYEEGESWATRAVTVLSKQSDSPPWIVGQARIMRGTCLTRLRRYQEAESEIRNGIRALTAEFGASHWRVDSARVRLAELERARGSVQPLP